MKIKSNNEASLLWTIGWLIFSLLLIVAIRWFFVNTEEDTLSSSSLPLSTTISKDYSRKNIPKNTFREILEIHHDETILLSVKDEASNKFTEVYRSLVHELSLIHI